MGIERTGTFLSKEWISKEPTLIQPVAIVNKQHTLKVPSYQSAEEHRADTFIIRVNECSQFADTGSNLRCIQQQGLKVALILGWVNVLPKETHETTIRWEGAKQLLTISRCRGQQTYSMSIKRFGIVINKDRLQVLGHCGTFGYLGWFVSHILSGQRETGWWWYRW